MQGNTAFASATGNLRKPSQTSKFLSKNYLPSMRSIKRSCFHYEMLRKDYFYCLFSRLLPFACPQTCPPPFPSTAFTGSDPSLPQAGSPVQTQCCSTSSSKQLWRSFCSEGNYPWRGQFCGQKQLCFSCTSTASSTSCQPVPVRTSRQRLFPASPWILLRLSAFPAL